MKVLHINTERTWRGGEQQTLYLAAGLHQKGIQTALVCQPGNELEERARDAGVRVHPLRMRGEWDLMALMALRTLLKKESFDIVHMHTSHAHTLGVAAARTSSRAKTVVARRVDFSIYRHPLSLSGYKYRFGVDQYIAISKAIRDVLMKDGIPLEKINIVHSGIDLSRFEGIEGGSVRQEFGLSRNTAMIGTVAHFAWHKGLEYLVDAAPLLKKELPGVKVFLVGEGKLKDEIKTRAREKNAEDILCFTGFRKDVPQFLHALDVFVMPSVMEGLCTSILDALASKKPVVASDVGGIPEIITHQETGLLVPPRDPKALAKAIIRLAKDQDLAKKLADKGYQKVKDHFSKDAMVQGSLKVYEKLLHRPP